MRNGFPGFVGLLAITVLFALTAVLQGAPATQPSIHWETWSDDLFDRARKENKFVLLDLEAVWCHWCHVMDHVTYSDPDVIALIGRRYIAVKVDQDSRPDISNRYEDFGWPATVVFNVQGGEIVKRQGYIPPGPMARMLQAIIDDPTPGPSVTPEVPVSYGSESSLPPELKKELEEKFAANYDPKEGGWGTIHKFLDWDSVEYCATRARAGDKDAEQKARRTLSAALKLIDPAWGGIYQYSTDGDWDHPHFEKIMQFQAEGLRTYALAFAQWHDPAYLKAAQEIRGYLAAFLTSPEGEFYTSQNADLVDGEHGGEYFALDDAARRSLGVPRIDRHVYSRENGWAINGLVALYDATGDQAVLRDALRAAQWTISHRSIEGGGFRHDENDSSGPYLADTLSMGRAFLSLYAATAEREWLRRATAAADFIDGHFRAMGAAPGFTTAVAAGRSVHPPGQELDENVVAGRFFNLLARYTGEDRHREAARNAMRYLATPQIARQRASWSAGILLADAELNSEPLHVTVVGSKQDAAANAMFQTVLRSPVSYKRLEWWDLNDGPLPNPDVQYPHTKVASAFVCTASTCSAPMTTVEALEKKLARGR